MLRGFQFCLFSYRLSHLQVYKITVDSMISLGELGLGSCGHVVRMKHKETGSIVAVKVS